MTPRFKIDVNENKRFDTAPDLIAFITLDNEPLDIAIWTRRTRDGSRIYHSVSIAKPYKKTAKNETLAKGIKVYEHKKETATDPDFQSRNSFLLFGKAFWFSMWMGEAGGELVIEGQLVEAPFHGKRAPSVQAFLNDLRTRQSERMEEAIEPDDLVEGDEVPF